MSDPAVMVAIREHLLAIPGLPTVIMPNEAKRVSVPFLTFDNGPTRNTPITIDGEEFFEMRPNVAIHVEPNTFTADGDAVLWSIAQAFSFGTPIMSGSTRVAWCQKTPVADGGMLEGGIFRRNMVLQIVSYQII